MSDSDKTRDKLVNSIRKTKAGAAKREPTESPESEARESTTPQAARSEEERPVSYMRGTRVWPD